jgi:hypothetical protein
MELEYFCVNLRVKIHLVHAASGILDAPFGVSLDHVDNIGWVLALFVVSDENFSNWTQVAVETFLCFGNINIRDLPPLDVAVCTSSYVIFSILEQDFDHSLVQGDLVLGIKHQMSFYKLALPNNESSVLCSTHHLSIG